MSASNPYGEFFKQAKKAKAKGVTTRSHPEPPKLEASSQSKSKRKDISEYSEAELRQLFKLDQGSKRKRSKRVRKPSRSDLAPVLHFLGLAALLVLGTVL
ncbi:MAG: hypothetical protein AAF202_12115, partial [Pseudomonadota bacterium]